MKTFNPRACASAIGRTKCAGGFLASNVDHVTRPLRWMRAYGCTLIQLPPTPLMSRMQGTITSVPQSRPMPCVEDRDAADRLLAGLARDSARQQQGHEAQ